MPISVTCPHCNQAGKLPDDAVGKTVRCPTCKKAFQTRDAIEMEPATNDWDAITGWFKRHIVAVIVAVVLGTLAIVNLARMSRTIEKANEGINKSFDEANKDRFPTEGR